MTADKQTEDENIAHAIHGPNIVGGREVKGVRILSRNGEVNQAEQMKAMETGVEIIDPRHGKKK